MIQFQSYSTGDNNIYDTSNVLAFMPSQREWLQYEHLWSWFIIFFSTIIISFHLSISTVSTILPSPQVKYSLDSIKLHVQSNSHFHYINLVNTITFDSFFKDPDNSVTQFMSSICHQNIALVEYWCSYYYFIEDWTPNDIFYFPQLSYVFSEFICWSFFLRFLLFSISLTISSCSLPLLHFYAMETFIFWVIILVARERYLFTPTN